VIGATGQQGGGVVRALTAKGHFKVRALSRHPDQHRGLADEVAEADLNRSRNEAEIQTQQISFELRTEYETAQKAAELLKIYREGLLPQARAEFEAGVAAYQNNRQDFQALLASFLDVLHLDEEYWRSAAERETALGRLEELTGLSMRDEGAKK